MIQPIPGAATKQRDVAVIDALALELQGQRRDLQVQVVDQLNADVDVGPPRIGDRETVEQLAAGVAEEVRLARFALAAFDGAFIAARTDPGTTLEAVLHPLPGALVAVRRQLAS